MYRRGYHVAVLCEECGPEFVIRNKMFFQAHTEGFMTAESACHQYAQWRFLYGLPIMIATNNWVPDGDMSDAAQWLRSNSILIAADGPLWMADGDVLAEAVAVVPQENRHDHSLDAYLPLSFDDEPDFEEVYS